MGVNQLWSLLEAGGERLPLSALAGSTIAIDLSVWICQSHGIAALKEAVQKPHLRTLFFRCLKLLKLGVRLVFVIDGQAPAIKFNRNVRAQIAREQKDLQAGGHENTSTFQRRAGKAPNLNPMFIGQSNECIAMLNCMGIPVLRLKHGESEAQCAQLNTQKHVDACVTTDSDAFVFGARVVIKNFSTTGGHDFITRFDAQTIQKKLGIGQNKFICLALLLGSDYTQGGVNGVGPKKALQLLSTLPEATALATLRNWLLEKEGKMADVDAPKSLSAAGEDDSDNEDDEVAAEDEQAETATEAEEAAVEQMPDYAAMSDAQLSKAVAKFGMKTMPRKQMIAQLENIWRQLHSKGSSAAAAAKSSKSKRSKAASEAANADNPADEKSEAKSKKTKDFTLKPMTDAQKQKLLAKIKQKFQERYSLAEFDEVVRAYTLPSLDERVVKQSNAFDPQGLAKWPTIDLVALQEFLHAKLDWPVNETLKHTLPIALHLSLRRTLSLSNSSSSASVSSSASASSQTSAIGADVTYLFAPGDAKDAQTTKHQTRFSPSHIVKPRVKLGANVYELCWKSTTPNVEPSEYATMESQELINRTLPALVTAFHASLEQKKATKAADAKRKKAEKAEAKKAERKAKKQAAATERADSNAAISKGKSAKQQETEDDHETSDNEHSAEEDEEASVPMDILSPPRVKSKKDKLHARTMTNPSSTAVKQKKKSRLLQLDSPTPDDKDKEDGEEPQPSSSSAAAGSNASRLTVPKSNLLSRLASSSDGDDDLVTSSADKKEPSKQPPAHAAKPAKPAPARIEDFFRSKKVQTGGAGAPKPAQTSSSSSSSSSSAQPLPTFSKLLHSKQPALPAPIVLSDDDEELELPPAKPKQPSLPDKRAATAPAVVATCPICGKSIAAATADEHVNECLQRAQMEDDEQLAKSLMTHRSPAQHAPPPKQKRAASSSSSSSSLSSAFALPRPAFEFSDAEENEFEHAGDDEGDGDAEMVDFTAGGPSTPRANKQSERSRLLKLSGKQRSPSRAVPQANTKPSAGDAAFASSALSRRLFDSDAHLPGKENARATTAAADDDAEKSKRVRSRSPLHLS